MKYCLRLITITFVILPLYNLKAQVTYGLSADSVLYHLRPLRDKHDRSISSRLTYLRDLSKKEKSQKPRQVANPFLNKRAQSIRGLSKISSLSTLRYVIDTAIVYTSYDTSRETFSYDQMGLLAVIFEEKMVNGQWTNSYLDSSAYDAKGNTLSEFYKYATNGQWYDSTLNLSTYDANGHLLSHLWLVSANNEWTNSGQVLITYDAKGSELYRVSQDWSNNQWVNSEQEFTTYDANENELTWLSQEWSNGQWSNDYREFWTYDSVGNKIIDHSEDWENGGWSNLIDDSCTYDKNRNLLSDFSVQGADTFVTVCTYDPRGNVLTELDGGWRGGQWYNSWFYSFSYDMNGNELSYLSTYWSNGQWTNDLQHTYTYDANNNLLTDLMKVWFSGQWINGALNTYVYDVNGNETSGTSMAWSDSTSTWIPSVQIWESSDFEVCTGMLIDFHIGKEDDQVAADIIKLSYAVLNVTSVSPRTNYTPTDYSLSQNYPNPFNPTTVISYQLPVNSSVALKVYDVLGREVATLANGRESAGTHTVKFDGTNLPSGVYFYRLDAGAYHETRKLLLLK